VILLLEQSARLLQHGNTKRALDKNNWKSSILFHIFLFFIQMAETADTTRAVYLIEDGGQPISDAEKNKIRETIHQTIGSVRIDISNGEVVIHAEQELDTSDMLGIQNRLKCLSFERFEW